LESIQRLISPRSVAVIGASGDITKTSSKPIAYLKKHNFSGSIYPVNPRLDVIEGYKCYADIASLPETPDVALVLLGADRTIDAVRELAQRGTPAAIVLASGFAETGHTGELRQQQLLEAACKMRILGPNTIGLVNLTDDIVLSASGALGMDDLPKGCIGVVSQSGGILGSLLSRAAARCIGLSKLISTSNEADLDISDFVNYLVKDEATQVIALYLESIRHPQKFISAVQAANAANKPVVVFKVGKSEAGALAAVSHTGALAGSDRMYEALFKHLHVIRAQTFNDLLDIPLALSTHRLLHGNRIAILTTTGGAGTLIADSLGVCDFETPQPDATTADALQALQPKSQSVFKSNPVDLTLSGLDPAVLQGSIRALVNSKSFDALVVVVGSSGVSSPSLLSDAVNACLSETNKPIIAYVSPYAPAAAANLIAIGVPAFTDTESCATALASMRHAAKTAVAQTATVRTAFDQTTNQTRSLPLPLALANLPTGALDEAQAKSLFKHYGIKHPREIVVKSAMEAEKAALTIGGQLVLKVLSKDILHKTEVGGVAIKQTSETIGSRLQEMSTQIEQVSGIKASSFLVQEMVSDGVEIILGMYKDNLGTAVLLGMGGVTAELVKDTTLRFIPQSGELSSAAAAEMIQDLKTAPLLQGYRGRPLADTDALIDAIVAFSRLVGQLGDHLVEAEINPLFVLPQGKGVLAADGVIILT
jgi:acetate---CoA ligase (ADP-forming)